MTTNQIEALMNDNETEHDQLTSTVGSLLKAGREQHQMSVDDIAQQLNLRPSLVEKLEQDCFDSLPSATYTRGYVRSFAKLVGVDEELVMACLDQQIPSIAEPAMQSFSKKTTMKARESRLMLVTYLIAFILLAMLVLWWVQKSSNSNLDLSKPSVEEVEAAKQTASNLSAISVQPSISTQSTISESSVKSESVNKDTNKGSSSNNQLASVNTSAESSLTVQSPNTSLPTKVISPAISTQSTNVEVTASVVPKETNSTDSDIAKLSIKLSGDSWLKIDDALGKTLVHGVKNAGQSFDIQGVEPINLVIGAPQVVKLQYNGQNVDLNQYPSGRVARLSLPRS